MSTAYHSKYIAYDLTRQAPPGDADQLSMSLFDASVDLNPHQIEAAMFALQSPISEGAILADEVGLGKTIEAGIVLCQKWAERKRRLLIICPTSIRQQWANELTEKFNLPAVVIDAKTHRSLRREGHALPLEQKAVVILSYHYAAKLQDELRHIAWDLVVIDEAHKLRNAYRPSNRIGQALRWGTEGRKKLLLTATFRDQGTSEGTRRSGPNPECLHPVLHSVQRPLERRDCRFKGGSGDAQCAFHGRWLREVFEQDVKKYRSCFNGITAQTWMADTNASAIHHAARLKFNIRYVINLLSFYINWLYI